MPEEDELVIDGIVVTGTKQDTTLQDLDVSATVIGREALKDARVTDIRRIDDLVPNVQFNDRGPLGAVYISIRGIESNPFIVNRAAVYIDGIPFRELNNSVLTQLESVEVLRGPQSTLYGANTESGLVVINTRAPGDEFTASSTLTATSFETGEAYQVDGYIAGPLIQDKLSGSISVRYSEDDFFVRNIGASPDGQGEIEETFVQGRLRWTPTERLTINATGYIIDTGAPGVYPFDGFPVDIERYNQVYSDGILFDPLNPFSPFPFNGDLRASDFEFISDAEKQVDFQDVVAGISAKYELDFGDVDLALSYRSEDTEEFGFDADLSNGPVLAGGETDKLELWNAELRYTSPIEDPLNYTIGISYYADDTANALGSLVGPGSFADYSFAPEQEVQSQDFGVFGSVSYTPPNVPKLTGTVGLRFDSANRKTIQNAGEFDLGFSVFVFDELTLEDTFEAALPRFAVKYEPSDNLTFYANVAKGYLPGGFNITAAQEGFQDDVVTYGSEEMWSYEAGARWNVPAADLYVAAAAFYIEADNY
ncbi:MAG: TonB-dependent receptor, partial [Pseudomonadota bacterium]